MQNPYPYRSKFFHRASLVAAVIFLSAPVASGAATSSVAAPCNARQLGAFDAGARDYGERRVTRIELIDNSPRACSLQGYPQLLFRLSSGARTPVLVRRTPVDTDYRTPEPATITIGSLERASFLLGYPKTKAGKNACVAISTIGIAFGGGSGSRAITIPDTISSCGTVNVSPYFIPRRGDTA